MTQNKRRELTTRIKKGTRNAVEYWLPILIICCGINLIAAWIKSELSLRFVICNIVTVLILLCIMVILNNIIVIFNFFVE